MTVQPNQPEELPTRGVRLIIAGGVLALLGPLAGFLMGSIVGNTRQIADYEARFASMFVGLIVGGIGVLVIVLGATRWVHAYRHGHSEERHSATV